jgi:threonyl-tRNA synthetase
LFIYFYYNLNTKDIAKGISQGLADAVVIAKIQYTNRYEEDAITACDKEDEEDSSAADANAVSEGELWDLNRPLVGDCNMNLLKFEDPEAKTVN